jgi:hypothetical protein
MHNTTTRGTAKRLRLLARVILFMMGCAVALAVVSGQFPKQPGSREVLSLGVATSFVAFALTVIFVRWEGESLANVGAMADRWTPLRLLVGLVIGAVIVAIWALVSAAGGYVRWKWEPAVDFSQISIALITYVALATREELAFHGYPLRTLERSFGVWSAQIFVAVMFALEHRLGGMTWMQAAFGAAVGSLLYGMASIATRGLAVPIGVHAAWNIGQWLLGLKGQPGVWRGVVATANEARAELFAMVAYDVILIAVTIRFWIYFRRTGNARPDAAN